MFFFCYVYIFFRKPLYNTLPANVSAMLQQIPPPSQQPPLPPSSSKQRQQHSGGGGGSPVDMDLDSPFSPGSGSDLSDMFEPPGQAGTPSTGGGSFLNASTANNNKSSPAVHGKKPWESSQWAKIIGGSGGGTEHQHRSSGGQRSKKSRGAHGKTQRAGKGNNKNFFLLIKYFLFHHLKIFYKNHVLGNVLPILLLFKLILKSLFQTDINTFYLFH